MSFVKVYFSQEVLVSYYSRCQLKWIFMSLLHSFSPACSGCVIRQSNRKYEQTCDAANLFCGKIFIKPHYGRMIEVIWMLAPWYKQEMSVHRDLCFMKRVLATDVEELRTDWCVAHVQSKKKTEDEFIELIVLHF